jgi:hypothetical protein
MSDARQKHTGNSLTPAAVFHLNFALASHTAKMNVTI